MLQHIEPVGQQTAEIIVQFAINERLIGRCDMSAVIAV